MQQPASKEVHFPGEKRLSSRIVPTKESPSLAIHSSQQARRQILRPLLKLANYKKRRHANPGS